MAAPKVTERLEQIVLTQAFILPDGKAQTDTIPPEVAAGLKAAAEANDGAVPADEGFVRGALISGNTKEEQDRVLSMLVLERDETDAGRKDVVDNDRQVVVSSSRQGVAPTHRNACSE